MPETPLLALRDVRAAAAGLAGRVHRTPVLRSRTLDAALGGHVLLKAECFQRAGSFKIRGALTYLSALDPAERARGVVASSSGNHGQAVALAAAELGTRALVVMPSDAPETKRSAVLGYGGEVVLCDRYRDDRGAIALSLAEERRLAFVPAFDHPLVMAGQGTAALELVEDAGPLDALLVPTGGGGLLAGCGVAAKALCPGLELIGVEPEAGDDTRASLEAGRRIRIDVPETIADGLQLSEPGELTFEVNRALVDDVALVTDAEIVAAMVFLFERLKVVVEPSGAAGVAALLAGKVDAGGRRVGVVLSGGNVGSRRFASLVEGRERDATLAVGAGA